MVNSQQGHKFTNMWTYMGGETATAALCRVQGSQTLPNATSLQFILLVLLVGA